MTTETSTINTAVAALSAAILALLGVDHFALIWGFVGALFSLTTAPPVGRSKALMTVALSTFIGAALGTLLADRINANAVPIVRIVAALVCAAGAQQLLPLAVQLISNRLKKWSGDDTEPKV